MSRFRYVYGLSRPSSLRPYKESPIVRRSIARRYSRGTKIRPEPQGPGWSKFRLSPKAMLSHPTFEIIELQKTEKGLVKVRLTITVPLLPKTRNGLPPPCPSCARLGTWQPRFVPQNRTDFGILFPSIAIGEFHSYRQSAVALH